MRRWSIIELGLAVLTLGVVPANADEVMFRVTFDATWSSETHGPGVYPGGAHFSPLVGVTHDSGVSFWDVGDLASVGIENMAEKGQTGPFNAETQAAIDSGTAFSFISGGGLDLPGTIDSIFVMNSTHPRVTLVTMVAPSPDWFVGVSGLDLRPTGVWVDRVVVDLYALDAGTDSGVDFGSPNADTTPADPVSLLGAPFAGTPALGTFTFERIAECNDGIDNDGDGLVDFPDDPGCFAATNASESPVCDNGEDDDNDGFTDFVGGDVGCIAAWGLSESACGIGFELALFLPPLIWLRGTRRRDSGLRR